MDGWMDEMRGGIGAGVAGAAVARPQELLATMPETHRSPARGKSPDYK